MQFSVRVFFAIIAATWLASGCSTLVGNIKPVDEKSDDYRVIDLSKENSEWEKLPAESAQQSEKPANPEDPGQGSTESSDIAYQSKATASIISMNTACRPTLKWEDKATQEQREQHLREFTRQLLLGISDIHDRKEEFIQVQSVPALKTTLVGQLSGQTTQLRTVVLRHEDCIYDLMYIARPSYFEKNEPDFARFVASLRLRK
jgi:hypothetical protein